MAVTITVGTAASKGQKEILTRYPITKGLIAGTTTQEGRVTNLVPQKTFIPRRQLQGL